MLVFVMSVLVFADTAMAKNASLLIAGDSWGTVIAGGSVTGKSFFELKLKEKGCGYRAVENIAFPGTMAADWDHGMYLNELKNTAKDHDFLWITLMGNDALDQMPSCASTGKNASECGDQLYASMLKHMAPILDGVHESNPDIRIVGFGYDLMFGGLGCSAVTHELFPQCWKGDEKAHGNRCFNTQFVRLQAMWEKLASTRDWVDVLNLLGTTQVAGGDTKAKIGSPDMDKMGPAKYWPDYLECFHPGIVGGDDSGAMVIMEEFYNQYWSPKLSC